jgi:hypothetical protein
MRGGRNPESNTHVPPGHHYLWKLRTFLSPTGTGLGWEGSIRQFAGMLLLDKNEFIAIVQE